jgi:hypothetical protein
MYRGPVNTAVVKAAVRTPRIHTNLDIVSTEQVRRRASVSRREPVDGRIGRAIAKDIPVGRHAVRATRSD